MLGLITKIANKAYILIKIIIFDKFANVNIAHEGISKAKVEFCT